MAGKTQRVKRGRAGKVSASTEAPALVRLVEKQITPILNERPPNSMTMQELMDALSASREQIDRAFRSLREKHLLHSARVRMHDRNGAGNHSIVYWVDETAGSEI